MNYIAQLDLLSPSLESSDRSELASDAPVRALALEDSVIFGDRPVDGGGDGSSDVKEPPDDGERAVDGIQWDSEEWARGGEQQQGRERRRDSNSGGSVRFKLSRSS